MNELINGEEEEEIKIEERIDMYDYIKISTGWRMTEKYDSCHNYDDKDDDDKNDDKDDDGILWGW